MDDSMLAYNFLRGLAPPQAPHLNQQSSFMEVSVTYKKQ
jgi:hypothetical protein